MRVLASVARFIAAGSGLAALLGVFGAAHEEALRTVPHYLHTLSLTTVGALAALLAISWDVARRTR